MQTLTLVLGSGANTDAEEVAALTEELRRRLLELDVEAVDLVRSDDIPVGARPIEAFSLGALAVTASASALKAVIDLVRAWLTARPIRTAEITLGGDSLQLTHAARADQERLVRAFVARHTAEQGEHG